MAQYLRYSNLQEPIRKNTFEAQAWAQNQVTCGIDEVGRGCLAGPLVAAAVILPIGTSYALLKDSKVMDEKERQKAAKWIYKHCWIGIGIIRNQLIDAMNIRQATLAGMKKALAQVLTISPQKPISIIIDAMNLELSDMDCAGIPIHYFCKAEKKSSSVAAASIIAKVYRDELMTQLNSALPGYAFDEHKGYGTQQHTEMVRIKKETVIHRVSFLKSLPLTKEDHEKQQTIC